MEDPQQSKLPKRLGLEFNRMILQKFREYEKIQKRIAAFENHLHFTLHCKHRNIFPPSLTVKCSMSGPSVDEILRKTQRLLLNERITRIYKQIHYFRNIKSDLDEYLFNNLPATVYTEVALWMAHAHKTSFNNIRSRQQQKF